MDVFPALDHYEGVGPNAHLDKIKGAESEQELKYDEMISLFLSSGYFRVNLPSLSPFDKIFGGLVWTIQRVASHEVNIHLLFQEGLRIADKTQIAEQIEHALVLIQCPHRLSSQQLIFLDYDKIYPVAKWLIDKLVDLNECTAEYLSFFSLSYFYKNIETDQEMDGYGMNAANLKPIKLQNVLRPMNMTRYINQIDIMYSSRHSMTKQLKPDSMPSMESSFSTFGTNSRRWRSLQHMMDQPSSLTSSKEEDILRKELEQPSSELSSPTRNLLMDSSQDQGYKQEREMEEEIQPKIRNSIISKFLAKYTNNIDEKDETTILIQPNQHQVSLANPSIQKETEQRAMAASLQKIRKQSATWNVEIEQCKKQVEQMAFQLETCSQENHQRRTDIENLRNMGSQRDQEKFDVLHQLNVLNQRLKNETIAFKASCTTERQVWKGRINKLQQQLESQYGGGSEDKMDQKPIHARTKAVLNKRRLKLQQMQAMLTAKHREITLLERNIDQVPSPSELKQYYHYLAELCTHLNQKFIQIKQCYNTYNALHDHHRYLIHHLDIQKSLHAQFLTIARLSKKHRRWLDLINGINDVIVKLNSAKDRLEDELNTEHEQHVELKHKLNKMIDYNKEYEATALAFLEQCHLK